MEPIKNEEIWLSNSKSLADIQTIFTTTYPYLKIDFFKDKTDVKLHKNSIINPKTTLSKLVDNQATFNFNFGSNRTILEIAEDFKNTLSLIARVSRKSGNVWLSISLTEDWTLQNQNAAGELLAP